MKNVAKRIASAAMAAFVALPLLGPSVPAHAQAASSGQNQEQEWRPQLKHDGVAQQDDRYYELIRELASAEGDQEVLDRWFALLEHVEANYDLTGDFHLEVLDFAIGMANFADAFQRYEIAIIRRLERVLPLIEARFGPQDERVLEMREDLAWRYEGQGRIEEAMALVGPDHRMFERREFEGELDAFGYEMPDELRVLVDQATSLSGDALIANLKQQSTIRSADNGLMFSAALSEIAIADELVRMGRLDDAIAHLEIVIDDREKAFMDLRLLVGQTLAHYLVLANRSDDAIVWLDRMEQEFGTIQPESLYPGDGGLDIIEPAYRMPQTNAQRALLYLQTQGDPEAALASARYTAKYLRLIQSTPSFGQEDVDEIARSRQAPPDEPFGQDARRIFSHLAEAAWRVAEVRADDRGALREEAFAAVQDAGSSSATAAIARTAAERAAENAGLSGLIDERKAVEARLQELKDILDGYAPSSAEGDEIANEYRRVLARQAEIDFELLEAAPEFFQLIRPSALTIDEARALLAPGEALLLIAPSEHATHIFAITCDQTRWHRSSLTATDIADLVEFLRLDLDPWGSGLSQWDAGYEAAKAYRLYAELIAPLEGTLSGIDTILYTAQGALATVPLTVLVTEEPADERLYDLEGVAWLADRYAFAQLPSFASLAYLRREGAAARPADASLSSFGDPLLEGEAAIRGARNGGGVGRLVPTRSGDTGIADVDQLRQLARLPGTRRELESLRVALGAEPRSVRLAERATESAVKQADLSDARFVAFATHGLLAGEGGAASEPGLVFTPPGEGTQQDDGLLSASEILNLQLSADWVILSACNTAAGSGGNSGDEALSGLARAFFYAGARSLLASHWPVSDAAAPVLTVEAVRLILDQPGTSRAEALRHAMQVARASEDIPLAAHPASWAAFITVGDPR